MIHLFCKTNDYSINLVVEQSYINNCLNEFHIISKQSKLLNSEKKLISKSKVHENILNVASCKLI